MGRRYTTAGWVALALATLAGGCQKKVVFDVANSSDDVRGVRVRLDDGSQYVLGKVGQRDRLVGELPISPSSLPADMTLYVGDLQASFVVADFVNADRIDQCFAVDGKSLIGPQMVPFPVKREPGRRDGHNGGDGEEGDDDDDGPQPAPLPAPSIPGALTDRQKQTTIHQQSLTLARMRFVADETIRTDEGEVDSTVAGQAVRSKLVELGFDVRGGGACDERGPGASCDGKKVVLELRLKGLAKKRSVYQGLYVYDATVTGELRNVRTGRVIATKSFVALDTDQEKRDVETSPDPVEAGRRALKSAGRKLVAYLTDETCRKWRLASLVKTRLVVGNVASARQLVNIHTKLRRLDGVSYVSVESWDDRNRQVDFEVLVTLAAEPKLVGYVHGLREGGVTVERISSADERIDAWRKSGR
jgi:hypothetical protein